MIQRLLIASALMVLASAAPEQWLPWQRFMNSRRDDGAITILSPKKIDEAWTAFKINYGRSYYDTSEDNVRKGIFTRHFEAIRMHNYLYSKGLKTFTMGINEFADVEHAEFLKLMTGNVRRNLSEESSRATFVSPEVSFKLDDEIDWRKKGSVTEVKSQGRCSASWAFSVTGALEGQTAQKTGKLVSLSEQQLIDCSIISGNYGCNGGWITNGFEYVESNGGLDTEESYPLDGEAAEECRYNPATSGATCRGYVTIERDSETRLQEAVASVGPVSVAIDASHASFQLYKEGVYDEPKCSRTDLDHAVLVVGYGISESGDEFWIVKNSWGNSWGMNGYIQMSRNQNNQCGIAAAGCYPLV